ncbi:MAG: transaldolase, partial [Actinomycetota bacterium]|nr:transaldolase [Actinomycetota bacterium]
KGILELYANPLIQGFTTNPTLMRKAGVEDYEWFARDILQAVPDRPFSLEVFADDHKEMERQALKISSWGEHVYVKVPVTNTQGAPTSELLRRLSGHGVKVNVTALMTARQVEMVAETVSDGPAAYVSVFAGRVADSGRDPVPIMRESLKILRDLPRVELIWASPRELLNIVQAHEIGCDIITVTHDVLKKLPTLGTDLDEFSLDTVQMFHSDASSAGYTL